MKTADEIIKKYLAFGGKRNTKDFTDFLREIILCKAMLKESSKEYVILQYIHGKVSYGLEVCKLYNDEGITVGINEHSKAEIEKTLKDAGYLEGTRKAPRPKPQKPKAKGGKTKKGKDLGKIVDHGNVVPRGKSDIYWGREGIDLVFMPDDENVRVGAKIPDTYRYADVRFLEDYYGLRAFEFGNWLSQQDRVNYLSGLGLALFDLHKAIGFSPKQIGIKGKLSVAFGARGRGRAVAHFEVGSFAINLARYSRPAPLKNRSKNFRRAEQILKDGGGVGAFAHEYGHALDFFGGLHIEKGDSHALSGDKSTRTEPDIALMKKKTLRGLMEKLLNKIIWKNGKTFSNYYERLTKGKKDQHSIQRCEIFARSFEIYVQYKLANNKHKNAFLNEPKYSEKFYLTLAEMKKIEPEFDALINALKKHLS